MSEFMSKPERELTREETLELLRSGAPLPETGLSKFRIKSQWLCDLLNEREATGEYQYNATFQRWFEREFNLMPSGENGSVLSTLIYNAQCYRRSDKLQADGWRPASSDLLQEAFDRKAKVELCTDGLMGSGITTLNVRQINGQLYAMKPRARNKAVMLMGQPMRLKEEAAA